MYSLCWKHCSLKGRSIDKCFEIDIATATLRIQPYHRVGQTLCATGQSVPLSEVATRSQE